MTKRILAVMLLTASCFGQSSNGSRNASAIQLLGTDPSACTQGTFWMNTTTNLVKVCLTTNTVSTVDTSASSSFPLLAPNGTAVAPSYSFSAQTGTGMRRNANGLAFPVNGTDQLQVDSVASLVSIPNYGISLNTGNVAIAGAASGLLLTEGSGPTPASGQDDLFGDSTTHTVSYNANNNGTSSFSGSWNCTNVTPVTVNTNTAADQNMMACTIPAGTLNRALRSLRVYTAGIYSTPAASTSQMTIKVKLCTVSGCGSGTVITPISIQSTALGTVQITNDNFSLHSDITTQTAGASSAYEAHGEFLIDLATLATAADSVFGDPNTGTIGTIDNTGQLFLQTTFAFSGASASNSATQRQLVVDTVN